MNRMLSFTCADLDMAYEAVYDELAGYLGIDLQDAVRCFSPDDAVARVRDHRRQADRWTLTATIAQTPSSPLLSELEDLMAR